MDSDMGDFADAVKDFGQMSLTQSDFRNVGSAPKSPHKINRNNKLRRYEESKQSVTLSNIK